MFTPEFMVELFLRHGWLKVWEVDFQKTGFADTAITELDTRPDRRKESLYFEAYK